MYEFEFERPTSIAEADAALSQEFARRRSRGLRCRAKAGSAICTERRNTAHIWSG
jgi:hypothetical protein